MRPFVSLCFPCFNEEGTIESVLREAYTIMAKSGYKFEILVCNDGSIDQTGKIIDQLKSQFKEMRVLHHTKNHGIQPTFEHLYAESLGRYIFLNSTDRQWDTSIVLDLLKLTDKYDIIVTRRINKPYKAYRKLISSFFNFLPGFLFGVQTFDAGSVKLVKKEVFESLIIISKSPFAEAERLIRASQFGYRITSIPVKVQERAAGKARGARISLVLMSILDLIKCFFEIRIKPLFTLISPKGRSTFPNDPSK